MDEQSLALSFGKSLTEEVSGFVGEFVEIGIDSILEDGLLKEIPFISTAVSIYHIGKSIRERHHVVKLAMFLNEINKGVADETDRQEYCEKFQNNEKFRNQELEYTMLLIDRYIGFEKPQMLAKLYLAYLREEITWVEFTMYAEVVDRFLPRDCDILQNKITSDFKASDDVVDSVQRLMAMGLVLQNVGMEVVDDGDGNVTLNNADGYRITSFGKKLKEIVTR